ncbi:hypothetical protein RYX36_024346 [Vicia faba]
MDYNDFSTYPRASSLPTEPPIIFSPSLNLTIAPLLLATPPTFASRSTNNRHYAHPSPAQISTSDNQQLLADPDPSDSATHSVTTRSHSRTSDECRTPDTVPPSIHHRVDDPTSTNPHHR